MNCLEMDVVAVALKAARTGEIDLTTLKHMGKSRTENGDVKIRIHTDVSTLHFVIMGWFCPDCYWRATEQTLTYEEFVEYLKAFYGKTRVVFHIEMPVVELEGGNFRCVSSSRDHDPKPGQVPKLDGVEWRRI